MKVSYAKKEDIPELERIARLSYEKMGLKELGFEYDKQTFESNIDAYIDNPDFVVLKCEDAGKVVGGLSAVFMPQLYSYNHTILQEIGLQSDPVLSDINQGKVIISLIKYLEDVGKDVDADLVGISFMPKYDLSKHLEKKGYKMSDIIFVRRLKNGRS